MNSYCAFVGRDPTISIAELCALLPDINVTAVIDKNIVMFDTASEPDQTFIDALGGTIALAKRLGESLSIEDVPNVLKTELAVVKRSKVNFGLRTHGMQPKQVSNLYRICKDAMKSEGRPCRYVGSARKPALPVVLHDHDMISGKHGCELCIIAHEHDVWIGKTVGAQNVDAYTKRDIDKPKRDKHVGLLPPKLAQILLNFGLWATEAKPAKGKKYKLPTIDVYDPFCGTGVIPLESLIRGWNVSASDRSKKAVSDCTTNLDWARKEYSVLKKDVDATVFQHDATKTFDSELKPDVIVTETSLGPPLSKRPTVRDVNGMKAENERLQAAFLKNASEAFPKTPIVCTFPVWYHSKGQTHLEKVWSVMEKTGYRPMLPAGTTPFRPEKPSLLYRRPGQHVGREIVILKPAS